MIFVAVLFGGHPTLLHRAPVANRFFDAQAHSLLEGRWDVPRDTLEIEGFQIGGKTYEYFGPLPALIRLPVAAVTTDLASRPFGFMALFPWVEFPPPPHTVGDVTVQWTPTSSFPAAMPLLAVLAVVGLVAILRPDRALRPSAAVLRLPALAAAAATVPTLAYAYLAQRYLSDLMPLAVLLAVAGLHALVRWAGRTTRRPWRAVVIGGVVVLGALSLWFNVGLAVL